MSTLKPSYGSQTNITCTITSLASSSTTGRQSTVVDNTSALNDDALVSITYKTSASALGTNPLVNIYVYALADSGNYSDGASGTDGSYTLPTGSLPILLGSHAPSAVSTAYTTPPRSVANAFGGVLPSKWGIIVQNVTGQTLDASTGNCSYLPVQYTNN